MGKKNDKKLCWNCDGNVSLHLTDCPYCGVSMQKSQEDSIPSLKRKAPFNSSEKNKKVENEVPKPPYSGHFTGKNDIAITDEEWKKAIGQPAEQEEVSSKAPKNEIIALLMLLPGLVFLLFAIIILLFSHEGKLILSWSESMAYFYFLGSIPLILLGWWYLKK